MKDIEKLEVEIVERIYKLFIIKFDGNKSSFAKASGCTETTIRRVLRNQQGITINLLIRIANALNTTPSDLLKGIHINKKE